MTLALSPTPTSEVHWKAPGRSLQALESGMAQQRVAGGTPQRAPRHQSKLWTILVPPLPPCIFSPLLSVDWRCPRPPGTACRPWQSTLRQGSLAGGQMVYPSRDGPPADPCARGSAQGSDQNCDGTLLLTPVVGVHNAQRNASVAGISPSGLCGSGLLAAQSQVGSAF